MTTETYEVALPLSRVRTGGRTAVAVWVGCAVAALAWLAMVVCSEAPVLGAAMLGVSLAVLAWAAGERDNESTRIALAAAALGASAVMVVADLAAYDHPLFGADPTVGDWVRNSFVEHSVILAGALLLTCVPLALIATTALSDRTRRASRWTRTLGGLLAAGLVTWLGLSQLPATVLARVTGAQALRQAPVVAQLRGTDLNGHSVAALTTQVPSKPAATQWGLHRYCAALECRTYIEYMKPGHAFRIDVRPTVDGGQAVSSHRRFEVTHPVTSAQTAARASSSHWVLRHHAAAELFTIHADDQLVTILNASDLKPAQVVWPTELGVSTKPSARVHWTALMGLLGALVLGLLAARVGRRYARIEGARQATADGDGWLHFDDGEPAERTHYQAAAGPIVVCGRIETAAYRGALHDDERTLLKGTKSAWLTQLARQRLRLEMAAVVGMAVLGAPLLSDALFWWQT